jgi:hypothetical protein
VYERSQHGLMHRPQATIGGRHAAPASAPQRIQRRWVPLAVRRGGGLLDHLLELAY